MICPCGGQLLPYWELKDGTLASKCRGCGRRHHIPPLKDIAVSNSASDSGRSSPVQGKETNGSISKRNRV